MTTTSFAEASITQVDPQLQDGYAEVGDVTLHYVEAGNGPLVLKLGVDLGDRRFCE